MKLVIIPAYNEEKTISKVISQIPKGFKIVVIDDGSTDNTAKVKAKVISHKKNRGVGVAFQTGVKYALKSKADIMVTIDADGQFNPKDIPKLIKPILEDEADFVTASRYGNIPKLKLWGNKQMARIISWLIKEKFSDVSCGFRAYNREALLNLNLFGEFTYTQETFLDLSFKRLRIKEVPIKVKYFKDRKSRVYKNSFNYAINALKIILRTVRDYRPLKFFGSIGLSIFTAGFILDVWMLIYYLSAGGFTPYKVIGLTGITLNIIGFLIIILALLSDMLYRIRINLERIIYYNKKNE